MIKDTVFGTWISPSLQSQKFWQDTLAGQAKNPLAREQFTEGCGSSETRIVTKNLNNSKVGREQPKLSNYAGFAEQNLLVGHDPVMDGWYLLTK